MPLSGPPLEKPVEPYRVLDRGLRAGAWSPTSLRLVTHRHIDDAAVEQAVEIVRSVAADLC